MVTRTQGNKQLRRKKDVWKPVTQCVILKNATPVTSFSNFGHHWNGSNQTLTLRTCLESMRWRKLRHLRLSILLEPHASLNAGALSSELLLYHKHKAGAKIALSQH